MKATTKTVLTVAALLAIAVSVFDEEAQQGSTAAVEQPAATETVPPAAPAPAEPTEPTQPEPAADAPGDMRQAAGDGDGDSWHDTGGREYRLGLVNTPESSECFGPDATAKRKELTRAGFRAEVYTTDAYGRSVAVVTLADGTNLNVWLARNGYANDKYLEEFRAENPSLAGELDEAFTAAKADRAGLWRTCSPSAPVGIAQLPPQQSAPAPGAAAPPAGAGCHPDYSTCIPVKGNGSGQGAVNDLDCGEIGFAVRLRQVSVDPYRLDREGDGVGCE